MTESLLTAFALMLVNDGQLRFVGLSSMLAGLILLYILRG
jgi:uncharacterized protein YjeT (DUF2065 family)